MDILLLELLMTKEELTIFQNFYKDMRNYLGGTRDIYINYLKSKHRYQSAISLKAGWCFGKSYDADGISYIMSGSMG